MRMNHLNTLVQRAIQEGSLERARALSERSRTAASSLFHQLIILGAEKAGTDPAYPFVFWHRGLAFESLGRPEEARKQFDAFGQGLIISKKQVPDDLLPAVREKLQQYELASLYLPDEAKL